MTYIESEAADAPGPQPDASAPSKPDQATGTLGPQPNESAPSEPAQATGTPGPQPDAPAPAEPAQATGTPGPQPTPPEPTHQPTPPPATRRASQAAGSRRRRGQPPEEPPEPVPKISPFDLPELCSRCDIGASVIAEIIRLLQWCLHALSPSPPHPTPALVLLKERPLGAGQL